MKKLMIMAVLGMLFILSTAAYAAVITGTSGPDNLLGTPRHDEIRAGKGNDTVHAAGGTDNVNGGPGADKIYGGEGEDFLRGHRGNDTIYAGDDSQSDEIRCGGGTKDVAWVTKADHSHNNITGCEDVNTLK